jgi:hypothetical protein
MDHPTRPPAPVPAGPACAGRARRQAPADPGQDPGR